ncbi:MAG TPA: glycosyltransferase, partial [Candidatus Aminicenantes bacterium]|nr:glycosyltransferase [Candidatus Aminicenantes bacterium]
MITATTGTATSGTATAATAISSKVRRVSPEKAEFAFIVASYNGARYLSRCARSIREKVGEGRYVLVVMDDASTDADVGEALERLRRREDTVVRVNPRNQGFSRNMNGGISLVLQGFPQVKYLVLLNQDTQLLTDITADALRAVI